MARYLFSSIHGGVSQSPFSSLNLGDHVGDDASVVQANRTALADFLSVSELVFMNQSHGTDIVEIGEVIPSNINADAIMTRRTSLGLAVLTADCIPLLIAGQNYVAAVHVGRKGLVGGIISRVLAELKQRGDSQFSSWIGPAICGKCYEVSPEMYREVIALYPSAATSEESHSLDLPRAAAAELEQLGVGVERTDICTRESAHHFSYRKAQVTGRMAGIISL